MVLLRPQGGPLAFVPFTSLRTLFETSFDPHFSCPCSVVRASVWPSLDFRGHHDILPFSGRPSPPLTFPNVNNHEKGNAEKRPEEIFEGRRTNLRCPHFFCSTSPAAAGDVQQKNAVVVEGFRSQNGLIIFPILKGSRFLFKVCHVLTRALLCEHASRGMNKGFTHSLCCSVFLLFGNH